MCSDSGRDYYCWSVETLPVSVSVASSCGSLIILCMGRVNSDSAVLSVATRTRPSVSWCTCVTRASGHLQGGCSSFLMRHRSPILMGG